MNKILPLIIHTIIATYFLYLFNSVLIYYSPFFPHACYEIKFNSLANIKISLSSVPS